MMAKELDFSDMQNCVCINLRLVTRAMTRFFDATRRRMGLRPTQTPILRALQAKSWRMAELSNRLAMERTTLVRNLRPLKRDGLVKVKGGGRGGRVELIITEKGRRKLAETYPAWRSAQEKVVGILGRERWTKMIHDLEHVTRTLKKQ
jgi:DNA-binding MarR family transcriptional regulator